jgi:hypothetical protein
LPPAAAPVFPARHGVDASSPPMNSVSPRVNGRTDSAT